MKSFECVVVGAGPAGSAAAIAARRAGLSVAVVDAAPHGRDKTCGDGLTPRAVHALQELGLDSALPAYRNKGLKLHGYGGSLTAPWPGGFLRHGRFRLAALAFRRLLGRSGRLPWRRDVLRMPRHRR